MAIIGPDTPSVREAGVEGQYFTNKIATTLAAFLNVPYSPERAAGEPLLNALRQTATGSR